MGEAGALERTPRWLVSILAAVVLVACGGGVASSPGPQPPPPQPANEASAAPTERPLRHVRYGQPSTAVQYLYLLVAQERGFYRAQGLEVELVNAPANVVAAALTAGELAYTAGVPGGIRLALRGLPLKVVSVAALQEYTFVTRPEIVAVHQLRGKPLGISAPGSTNDRAVQAALRHLGVDPNEVTLVAIGDPSRQLQALQAGAIEGAALSLPYSVLAQREGFPSWVRTDSLYRAVNTGLVAPQSRIDERREEVLGLIRAERAAIRYLKAERAWGATFVAERFGLEPEVAQAVYERTLEGYPEASDLTALRDAIEDVIATEKAAAGITNGKGWTELVDPTLAVEAAGS
ncbi:MAG: ABC transporter substrate-binding protein [Chloroflexi bacterium]|nr:ABC transporter substrate-binding protein [Chloroflexota bacterium]